ncbi:hypothetical protein [Luteimonas panaciterrae]|uniref:hypothetical protein n=1 Tax=Luteimonas panaciterrae TaxID=363885 RepID=UPI001CFBF560|nr:hypothetical protein [Luteimonas panaciterrae]
MSALTLMPLVPVHAQGLGTLGGNFCAATNTNNAGAVVGTCRDVDGHVGAVYWAPGTELPIPLSTLEPDGPCSVYDINNANVAAGNCEQGAAGEFFPVRWTLSLPSSLPQRLNPLLGHVKARARIINHAGVVGGASLDGSGSPRAVIWRAGQASAVELPELGLLPPLLSSSAGCQIADMTDDASPVVVGTCSLDEGGSIAVQWKPGVLGHTVSRLPRLPDGSNCSAAAINQNGQIAGTCETEDGDIVAVRWAADGTLTYLDDLQMSGPSREQLMVVDMNEAGIIVGNYLTDEGFSRAFVWSPVDDPESEEALDIGGLGGFWTMVTDIADDGTFTGESETSEGALEGLIGSVSQPTVGIGTLGGFTSAPAALSDSGNYLVGTSQLLLGYEHAFILSAAQKKLTPDSISETVNYALVGGYCPPRSRKQVNLTSYDDVVSYVKNVRVPLRAIGRMVTSPCRND